MPPQEYEHIVQLPKIAALSVVVNFSNDFFFGLSPFVKPELQEMKRRLIQNTNINFIVRVNSVVNLLIIKMQYFVSVYNGVQRARLGDVVAIELRQPTTEAQ